MQTTFASAGIGHGFEKNGMLEEFAVLDHQLNAGTIHVDDAAGADIQMTDFAVTHLSVGQPNIRAAGLNQRIGVFTQQPVIHRLAGESDGVGFGLGAVSPAVEDDENERFGAAHFRNLPRGHADPKKTTERLN